MLTPRAGQPAVLVAIARCLGPGWVLVDNLLNLAMLLGAAIASMAFGILAAYGILRAGFALIRPAQRPAVNTAPKIARVPQS